MNKLAKFAFAAVVAGPLILLNQNCSSPSSSSTTGGDQSNAVLATSTELSSSTNVVGSDNVTSHMMKLTNTNGEVSYAQWIPPLNASVRSPVVVVTAPYDAISWSDSTVDQEWFTRTNGVSGVYADVNGPNYNASTSQKVSDFVTTPEQYAQQWYPLIKSGFGILVTYGRFYSGGDMNVAIRGVGAGLDFLATQSSVDTSRIGIFGISLGGLQAIYGTTVSKTQPKVGVAWSALSDGPAEKAYVAQVPTMISDLTQRQNLTNFFEPYLRRMPADLSTVTPSQMISKINTHFLFIHDDWDMLVPSSEGRAAAATFGSKGEGFWFPHLTPIQPNTFALDHQQSSEGVVGSVVYTLAQAYLEENLTGATDQKALIGLYTAADFTTQFAYFRAQQRGGNNIQTLLPRMIDLCDPRMYLIDLSNGNVVSGASVVAGLLQSQWGLSSTTVNAANVKAYLQQNGLPN